MLKINSIIEIIANILCILRTHQKCKNDHHPEKIKGHFHLIDNLLNHFQLFQNIKVSHLFYNFQSEFFQFFLLIRAQLNRFPLSFFFNLLTFKFHLFLKVKTLQHHMGFDGPDLLAALLVFFPELLTRGLVQLEIIHQRFKSL